MFVQLGRISTHLTKPIQRSEAVDVSFSHEVFHWICKRVQTLLNTKQCEISPVPEVHYMHHLRTYRGTK